MVDFSALSAPFPPQAISWRVGSTTQNKEKGMALAFIDARDVMERLDAVCGPGGWQCRYPHANGKTVCAIGIKADDEWIWKEDGAGDTDVEAEKGALSDAFKRAAVRWGIGRYLYDLPSPWVELEPAGRSYKISAAGMTTLRNLLVRDAANTAKPAAASAAPPSVPAQDALRLMEEIEACKSMAEIDACANAPAFKGALKALPPELQTQVKNVGTQKRESLASREAA